MPSVRKRPLQEDSPEGAPPPAKAPSLLQQIRNMWQFANLFQFIMLFGKALKVDDNFDMEDLEAECLKPGSMFLQEIGLGFLKFLSSHRGLTHELFDEYTRKQYLSKAPEKNPFGTDDTPARFADFDVPTKVRVLQQMSQFVMAHPERLRERTEEQKDMDQTGWRIEPYGWDRDDRTYFVLDDNRIYRLSEAPPPPPKPKKNTKKAKAAQRASKRRRVSSGVASDHDDAGDEASDVEPTVEITDDGLGGMKWECLAVTLDEVRGFLSTFQKTKDPNEKVLRDQIQGHLVPILEKQEESRKRKQLQREKELLNLEKLAHAKRSSRLASKAEHQKQEEQAREEERKRREEEAASKKEEQRRLKMERERDNRLMSREQRLKEREVRRLQHEEELAHLSEDSKSTGTGPGRLSERRRLAEIERNKKALQELEEEEDEWMFDCICGVHGQIDDGTHSVSCERCNVWQHSKCLNIAEEEAEQEDFHFVCNTCRRRETAEAGGKRPRTIKLKVKESASLATPHAADGDSATAALPETDPNAAPGPSSPASNVANGSISMQPAGSSGQATLTSLEQAAATTTTTTTTTAAPTGAPVLAPQASSDGRGHHPFSSPPPNLHPPERPLEMSTASPTTASRAEANAGAVGSQTGQTGLAGQASVFNGPSLAVPAESGVEPSPSKQSQPPSSPPTKTSSTLATATPGPSLEGGPSGSAGLPHLTPAQSQDDQADGRPSPLPPSSAGLSPVKHSPPPPQRPPVNSHVNGTATPLAASNPPLAVFPPVAALSPSPQLPIVTPPVKPSEPARAPLPQQHQTQGLQTPKLVPSTSL